MQRFWTKGIIMAGLSLSLFGCGSSGGVFFGPDGPFLGTAPSPGPIQTPAPPPTRTLIGGAIQGIALALTNAVTTFAGTAGTVGTTDDVGGLARFNQPYGVTTDGTNLYVAEKDNNSVRKIVIATRLVSTLVPRGVLREPVGITNDGTFAYVCDSQNNAIRKVALSDGTMTLLAGGTLGSADGIGGAAQFNDPYGITFVGGQLYVADRRNHTIRQVDPNTGEVTTFAGTAGISGATNDTGSLARFNEPMSITTDGTHLYVGDWNSFTVRKIVIATRQVTTLAGTVNTPGAADGIGGAASFYGPRGLTSDGTNLFVADFYNRHGGAPIPVPEPVREASLIRKVVLATGEVTTIAGAPDTFGSLDSNTGTSARFQQPSGITTDGFSLFVADRMNNAIREIR